ncbi:MAG: hypothetical protein ACRDKW_18815, partial [Actinomycetota bacterium]
GSSGLSGKTLKSPRPTMSSRWVIVAWRYADRDDGELRAEHEVAAGRRLEEGPEIRVGKRAIGGTGHVTPFGNGRKEVAIMVVI